MKVHDYRNIKVNPEFTNLSGWVNVCELLKTQPSWEVYDTCLEAYWPEPDIDVVIRLDWGRVAEVSCNYEKFEKPVDLLRFIQDLEAGSYIDPQYLADAETERIRHLTEMAYAEHREARKRVRVPEEFPELDRYEQKRHFRLPKNFLGGANEELPTGILAMNPHLPEDFFEDTSIKETATTILNERVDFQKAVDKANKTLAALSSGELHPKTVAEENGVIRTDCGACYNCIDQPELGFKNPAVMQMVLCVLCGNKRCPHSTNHNYECTNSNEAGQPGSRYPK